MKDTKLWAAILILIGLIVYLIIISSQRSEQIKSLIQQVQSVTSQAQQPPTYSPKPIYKTITVQGTPGPQGPQGQTGATGKSGKNGANGKNGSDGQSVYQLWLSLGNTGTPTDFINALHGEDGASPPTVELRCDSSRLENEWRYVGTTAWQPLDKITECAQ